VITAYTLPPDKLAKAIEYARERNVMYFVGALYGFAVLAAILWARLGPRYRAWAERATPVRFLQAYLFAPLLLLTIDLAELPVAMRYHWLAVKYEQSIQPWASWIGDWMISEAISLAVAGLLVWLLYAIIRRSPRRWWVWAWLASIPLTVFAVWVEPVVVQPLYYRFTPLASTQPALVGQIERVTARGGLTIPRERMFEMNASSKLRSINAYVTGVGGSKRVVVWDTTLKTMTTPETLFVFGHEMGHYVMHHVWLGIALGCVGTLLLLWIAHVVLRRTGLRIDDYASLPALLLVFAVCNFFGDPIVNSLTRVQEHHADVYGLEVIHGVVPDPGQAAAQAFQIMGEIGLADPAPGKFIEFWLYSHPSVSERVRFASEYDPWRAGQPPKYVR
jgi:Zn-dependent protease with chaperone function